MTGSITKPDVVSCRVLPRCVALDAAWFGQFVLRTIGSVLRLDLPKSTITKSSVVWCGVVYYNGGVVCQVDEVRLVVPYVA